MSTHGKHTKNPDYDAGDNWVTCQVCGFDLYASESIYRWDGLLVCPDDNEPRHPQDFVRARQDKIAADVTNTDSTDVVIEVTYSDQGADSSIPSGTFNEDTL